MKNILVAILSIFQSTRRGWLKLTGNTENDIHEQRIVSGKAWAEFCDNLKAAGAALVYPGAPQDAASQAEGIRYLSRLTRAGLEAFIEYGDPAFPIFRRTVDETIKMGADNPDNHYLNAQISGDYEYIITGQRNSIHYIGFFTQNGNYGTTGGLAPCGILENDDLKVKPDGSIEIILSAKPRGDNWLKITSETSLLMVRQTYLDRHAEEPAALTIKAIGAPEKPSPVTAAYIDQGLNTASMFTVGAPMLFSKWANGFKKHPNQLPMFDPAVSNAAGGDASIIYYHSYWQLAPDEALVINTMPPACDTWNFQLNNYWMESLDYRYFNICINSFQAEYNADGSITVVVAHEDPGCANWIETAGHFEGTMCWRWYRPTTTPPQELTAEVVQLAAWKNSAHA
jgi:hypothetical protein